MSENTLNLIKESEARWVDLRFTDTRGKEQHVSIPVSQVDADLFESGKMFDGSSIAGWKGINESDMILMPDDSTPVLDPFTDEPTVNLRCDIVEPSTMQGYGRDPRSVAERAEEYLKSTGIGDRAFFGNEPEFFVFDEVKWHADMSGAGYTINSEEAAWASSHSFEDGNIGHRPGVKGGYFPVPPVDSMHDIRSAMCSAMEQMGLKVEVHHHEVGTAGQCEIGVRFDTLVMKADATQILKYCVHNVAHAYGKTATFMPKPLVGDNGSGMHCHQSIAKGDENVFAGDGYAGKDLYDLPPEEAANIPTVCASFEAALTALDEDRAFLTAGGVFSEDMIDGYLELKREEVETLNMTTHPVEFDMYYSV